MENTNYLVTPDSHQGVPHITPERLATLHRGTIANNDYVLSTGRKFETEIISNNVIRVYDGALIQGGIRGEIERGDYKDVQISNGIIGMKRNTLIVCRWFIDEEDVRKTQQKLIAVDGVATDQEPIDPEVNTNLIEDGAKVHDTVLYRVVKDGLDIVKVEVLFKILMNAEELMEMQKEINSKLENTFEEHSIGPYTYTIHKFNHGNQKFAKIHGMWTGSLGGSLLNGFYQSSITNLGVINSGLGLQIKRIIAQSFYFTRSEGALIFVGLTGLDIKANSINGTIQFLKSQQTNNCRLEWDIEVELL